MQAFALQASAAQLPFQDGTISFVFAIGILFHLSQKEMASALLEIRRVLNIEGKAVVHFLDIDDWRRSIGNGIHPVEAPMPSYKAVVTCFCPGEKIRDWIEAAGLWLESLELETSTSQDGEQRNWLATCKKQPR